MCAFTPATIPAGAFTGGLLTEAVEIAPGASETDATLIANALTSGNPTALVSKGKTLLYDEAEPLTVHRSADASTNPVLKVTTDGKLSLTPDINTQSAPQPALAVDAAAAITNLFRLRTGANDVCTVDKTGTAKFYKPGGNFHTYLSPDVIQLIALNTGSDIELCQSDSSPVVQVTDDGKLGFFNHAAAAQPNVGAVPTALSITTALVALGLVTSS
jgi:hypothetical protein